MKRMLINATHTDEIRVAIADGQKLYDLDIDSAGHYRKKGNIYKAKITRIEPSLEACFVNYGSERHGFLPYKEISPAYCKQAPRGKARLPINQALNEGDEIIVQVNKEERGNKGAALSTFISLAGRYLVYMPGNQRAGGISRQIRGEKRANLQDIMRRLEIPKNDGVIIRTAGLGRTFEELHWDFKYLQQVWEAIQTTAKQKKGPFFIYQESDLFIRALRDYLQPDIGEILIDDRDSYEKAREFMQQVMPHNLKKLSYYNDNTPLFSRYQIERQIQSAFEREVKLPSGGALVIDQTEALLSIDINSAKATKGVDVETTALNTNLEAADEIARQLKIRDLGGLVVIDFIDMRNHKNQREVENRIRDAAESDRARVQIGKISKFGLLEMSRQRLRSSISDSSQITCPTCGGHGYIRSMESLVISIIRLAEEEMIKPKTGRVVIQAPVDTTNKILNEKRTELADMESRHNVQVSVISNDNLSFPDFHVQRLNTNESNINVDSIELVKPEDCHKVVALDPPPPTVENPALSMVKPTDQAPKRSLLLSISSWFKRTFANKQKNTKKKSPNKPHKKKPYNKNNQGQKNKQHPKHKSQKPAAKKPPQQKQQSKQGQQQKPQQHKNQKPTAAPKKQPPKQAGANKTQNQKPQKPQPNKSNQAKAQTGQKRQTNNQKSSPQQKVTKSIYGKNQQNRQNKPSANNTEDKEVVANKNMSRPLGSVAELASKKDAVVPSGAKKVRPIDGINVDAKLQASHQPAEKQTPERKAPEKKAPEKKAPEKKAPEKKAPEKKAPEKKAPEKQAPEKKAPEKKAPEKKAPEKKAPEKKAPEKQATERKAPKKKAPEKKAPEKQATEKQAPKKKAPEKQATEKKAPKKKAPEKQATEKQAAEKKAPEKQAPEKQAPEKQATEKKTPEKKAPEKQATEKQALEKKATEKQATEKKAPEKQATEKKATEKKAPEKQATVKKSAAKATKAESNITAKMIKPGLYQAKKSD